MKNFSRKNLNNIKYICSEKTGVDLPEKRSVSGVKIAGIVVAIILVLTPLTAYGAQYTMNFLEYLDSENNVKVKALEFVDDFMDFTYGDSNTYLDDDGEDGSFYDFIRHSAYLFKYDNSYKTVYDLGYSVFETVETRISTVKNEGSSWYVVAHADVEESNYTGVINEYIIMFYLKYDGLGEYFTLTDMYFNDTVGHSETVFGQVDIPDTMHFMAWAENNDDYSIYIKNVSTSLDMMEKDQAEKFAIEFMWDYTNYFYGGVDAFADKEGIIYSILDNIRNYKVLSGGADYTFKVEEIFRSNPISVRLNKIDGYWYSESRICGEILNADGEHLTDYSNHLYLKFKDVDGEYVVEDLNMFGANSDSYKIFWTSSEEAILGLDSFIPWADETDDYLQFLANSYDKIDDYLRDKNIEKITLDYATAFVNAAFADGENIWDNGENDDLTVFIREYVDYLKLSSEMSSSDYTIEIREVYLPTIVKDKDCFISVRANVTEHKTDGTEVLYMTKFFFKYDLSSLEPILVDFYFYGTLPQTHEVFEKVGKNNYSLTEETFEAWAAENNDYSIYTQKVRDAVAKLGK